MWWKILAQWYIQHRRKYLGQRENLAFISELCNSLLFIYFLIAVSHTSSICTGFASQLLLYLLASKQSASFTLSKLPGSC